MTRGRAGPASALGPLALGALALAVLAACAAPPDAALRPFRPPPEAGPGAGPVLAAYPRVGPRLGPSGLPTAEATAAGAERAFVAALLSDLQLRSFAGNREFCGYVGLDRAGRLAATAPVAGAEASCPLPPVPAGLTLVASYHTHSTYSPFYASEWPTSQDVATDAADGIDGYISTPGGRLWHVDTDTMTVRELCGRGCLPQDPAYVAEDDGPIRPLMTYADLLAWENGSAR